MKELPSQLANGQGLPMRMSGLMRGCGSAGVRVARLMTWQERLATLRDIGRWSHALLSGLSLLEASQVLHPSLTPGRSGSVKALLMLMARLGHLTKPISILMASGRAAGVTGTSRP